MNENRYFEKVANRLKDWARQKGYDVDGMSSGALDATLPTAKHQGTFNRMSGKAARIGGEKPNIPRPSPWGKADPMSGLKAKPLSQGASDLRNTLSQSKTTLHSALEGHVAGKAETAGKGILGKALQIAKRNPIATAGAALAGGALVHHALSGGNKYQSQYQGYGQ